MILTMDHEKPGADQNPGDLNLWPDMGPRRQYRSLGNNNNAVPDCIGIGFNICSKWKRLNFDILTHPHVLIDDRTFNITVLADPNGNAARIIIVIRSHQHGILDPGAALDITA